MSQSPDSYGETFTRVSMALGPGTKLGAYRLDEPLGRGGMGLVWKAWDGKRAVAIKLLPPEFSGNREAIQQVRDTFDLVQTLTHEHIGKTLDFHDDSQFGPYLVLEYIPGVTLSEYRRQSRFPHKRLPASLVRELLHPVARALDYAHQRVIVLADGEHRGVLHRDVKPDNILVVERSETQREVWLIDYGLASAIRATQVTHTNARADTRGTRPYMAPEQIKGQRRHWDARTDQYALAVVAYELLAGYLPFENEDELSLMLAIQQESAEPIAELPAAVNHALLRALSKNKEERFASCVAFIDSLASASVAADPAVPSLPTPTASPVAPRSPLLPSTPQLVPVAKTVGFTPELPPLSVELMALQRELADQDQRLAAALTERPDLLDSIRSTLELSPLLSAPEVYPAAQADDLSVGTRRRVQDILEYRQDLAAKCDAARHADLFRIVQRLCDELEHDIRFPLAKWLELVPALEQRYRTLSAKQLLDFATEQHSGWITNGWPALHQSNDSAALQRFLVAYPDSRHTSSALARLAELRQAAASDAAAVALARRRRSMIVATTSGATGACLVGLLGALLGVFGVNAVIVWTGTWLSITALGALGGLLLSVILAWGYALSEAKRWGFYDGSDFTNGMKEIGAAFTGVATVAAVILAIYFDWTPFPSWKVPVSWNWSATLGGIGGSLLGIPFGSLIGLFIDAQSPGSTSAMSARGRAPQGKQH